MNASCTQSSASATLPVMRRQSPYTLPECERYSASKARGIGPLCPLDEQSLVIDNRSVHYLHRGDSGVHYRVQ